MGTRKALKIVYLRFSVLFPLEYRIYLSVAKFCICRTPLFLRLIFTTPITSLWPVDFPFKILISGNHTGFQFIHSNYPFFQKIIQNPIIKPHTDRSMGRPAIIVMVVNGSVSYFIAFFTGKFPREKQMQCRWIKFIQPEKQFHHFGSVTSSGIIEGIRIDQEL